MLTNRYGNLSEQGAIPVVTLGNMTREPAKSGDAFKGSVSRQVIRLCADFCISEAATKEILRKTAEDVVTVGRARAYRRALNRIYDMI